MSSLALVFGPRTKETIRRPFRATSSSIPDGMKKVLPSISINEAYNDVILNFPSTDGTKQTIVLPSADFADGFVQNVKEIRRKRYVLFNGVKLKNRQKLFAIYGPSFPSTIFYSFILDREREIERCINLIESDSRFLRLCFELYHLFDSTAF